MGLSPAERQRRHREKKYAEWANLPPIPCACGCGKMIPPINKNGIPATYAHGHNPEGREHWFQPGMEPWNKGKKGAQASTRKGTKLPAEQITQRTLTRRAKRDGLYQTKRGWKHTPETIERMRIANLAHAKPGALNPAWEGGKSFEPYDATFNLATKRRILKRDDHHCQDCGILIGRRKGARKANIHHIDCDKQNTTDDNLLSLCVPCHQRRHWALRKANSTATD